MHPLITRIKNLLTPERWLVLGLTILRRVQGTQYSVTSAPNILVVRLDQLGDVLMTIPMIEMLRTMLPDCTCTLLVQEPWGSLLSLDQRIDRVVKRRSLAPRWLPTAFRGLWSAWRTYREHLRSDSYDIVISPRFGADLHQATFVALLNKSQIYLGYRSDWQIVNPFCTYPFPGGVMHEVLRNLDTLHSLAVKYRGPIPRVAAMHVPNVKFTALAVQQTVVIALGLGSNVKNGKRWPISFFAECLHILEREIQVQAVVVCSPEETLLAAEFQKVYGTNIRIVSDAHLEESAEVLKHCHLFIGNDSGGAHLAAFVGIPVVVVSAHTSNSGMNGVLSPHRFRPWTQGVVVAMPARPLDPCTESCAASEPHCILQNTPATVAELALNLLRDIYAIRRPQESYYGS